MRLQPFAVRKRGYYRPQGFESIRSKFLGSDVLLEGERVHTAKLACVAICRQRMVRSRCVVSAAAKKRKVRGRAEGRSDHQRHS